MIKKNFIVVHAHALEWHEIKREEIRRIDNIL